MSDEPEFVEAEELPPTVSPGRRETTLDRLRAYYAAKEDERIILTAHEQAVLARYEAAWALLVAFKSTEQTINKLMSGYELSRAQAYRDIANCKQLFGDVVRSSKEAERHILKEMAMRTAREAIKQGPKFLKEVNKAIANLIKITGIEHDDPSLPDPETFLPSNYTLVLEAKTGKTLTLNLETIAELPAHEYEEVMSIIQQSGVSEVEMMQKINDAARGIVE